MGTSQEVKGDNDKKSSNSSKVVWLVLCVVVFSVVGVWVDISRARKTKMRRGYGEATQSSQEDRKIMEAKQQTLLNMKRIISAQDTFYFMHDRLASSIDELGWRDKHGCVRFINTWESRESNPQPPKGLLYKTAVRLCRDSKGDVISNGCYIVSIPQEKLSAKLPLYIICLYPIKTTHSFKKVWSVFELKDLEAKKEWVNRLDTHHPLDVSFNNLLTSSCGMRYDDIKAAVQAIK